MAKPAETLAARADTAERYEAFQRFMFKAVTRPLVGDDETDPTWTDGRPANELLGAFVKGDDFRNPLRRVQTYNRMYWYRTLDSLAEDFPGVRAITAKKFIPLAEAYLQKHPSTSFTLRHLGHAFPSWLKKNSFGLPTATAFAAAECASLEWALCRAFEMESADALDPSVFPDPSKLKATLQPHLTLHALSHDAPAFLDALRLADNEHAEAGNAAAVAGPSETKGVKPRMRKTKTFVATFRTRDNGLATLKLESAEYALLTDLAAGRTLGKALERVSSRKDAPDAADIGRWFAAWSGNGWLCSR